jgi:hypothetical protein
MKFQEGWQKYIIRKALEREGPKEIVWRKDKKGYVTPETEIFRTHLDAFLQFVPALKSVGVEVTEDQMRHSILGTGKLIAHTRLLNLGAWLSVNKLDS